MTREEAINKWVMPAIKNTWNEKKCDEIIKALEQSSCDVFDEYGNYKYPSDVELTEPNTATSVPNGDLISRNELLKAIDTWDKFGCDADTKLVPHQDHYIPYIHYDDVVKCIKDMPSVKPQEPCEDEYIKVPKKALKYRTAGMVAYNAEWLKNHFDIERLVVCGEQEPCEDAISRQEVLDLAEWFELNQQHFCVANLIDEVENIPSVQPKPKTGHWIEDENEMKVWCSECGEENDKCSKCCPNCGCRMVEPQESEDKE